ncbi:MAG: hypothetical protein IH885_00425 [Myxococcales bacterium]|nr:hypothetical protein [Myxococcales bacterium]
MGKPQVVVNLPLNEDVMFSNHKGVYKKGLEKRQRKMLAKAEFLEHFLRDGEEILLISQACSPTSLIEQLTTGAIVYYLKRALLVVTNQRILHVPTKMNLSYRNSISQILYGDCTQLVMKRGQLFAKYRDGSKENFLAVKEKKKFKVILPDLLKGGMQSNAGRRTHLCPRCTTELEAGVFSCSACQLEFKSKKQGMKYSILIPGGGYFYTRHPILGLGDAAVEVFLIGLVLVALFATGGEVAAGESSIEDTMVMLGIFGGALAYEKMLSIYHANHFIKEFIPKEKNFAMEFRPMGNTLEPTSTPEIHRPIPIG